jgi:hypothetical protein
MMLSFDECSLMFQRSNVLKTLGTSDTESYPRRPESLHSPLSQREAVRKNTSRLVIFEVLIMMTMKIALFGM